MLAKATVPLWIPAITHFTPITWSLRGKVISNKGGGCRRCRRRRLQDDTGAEDGGAAGDGLVEPFDLGQSDQVGSRYHSRSLLDVGNPETLDFVLGALEVKRRMLQSYGGQGVEIDRNTTCQPTNYTRVDWSLVFPPVKQQGWWGCPCQSDVRRLLPPLISLRALLPPAVPLSLALCLSLARSNRIPHATVPSQTTSHAAPGLCASGSVFAMVALAEAGHFFKTGEVVSLSEQVSPRLCRPAFHHAPAGLDPSSKICRFGS
jgi:hypothetical protein